RVYQMNRGGGKFPLHVMNMDRIGQEIKSGQIQISQIANYKLQILDLHFSISAARAAGRRAA
ncbi:MAG: hypothetical protein L0922_00460, partial [Candidatus Mariimomonas ferrooxydans]